MIIVELALFGFLWWAFGWQVMVAAFLAYVLFVLVKVSG